MLSRMRRVFLLLFFFSFAGMSCSTLSNGTIGGERSVDGKVCPKAVLLDAEKTGRLCVEPASFGLARVTDCRARLQQKGFQDAPNIARQMSKTSGKKMVCYAR